MDATYNVLSVFQTPLVIRANRKNISIDAHACCMV